jgi:DHA3 family macrolide efflux protein-like MFS transporter
MTLFMDNWKKIFLIIWTGQFFSILTSSIVNFAIIIWLSINTGSAEILAYAAIASLLPQSLIGPFAGVYIDRWDRKLTMILADGFIALCTLTIAILFYSDLADLWYIIVLLALRSIGSAFHMPAMQASVPLIAPESKLLKIAGINQSIQSVSTIAGPALGALAITTMDIEQVLLLDIIGAGMAIAALCLVTIPNPDRSEHKTHHIFREIISGVREVTRQSGLRWLFFFAILSTLCIMPVSVLFPLMTLNYFGGDVYQVSLIEVIWGVGMLLGGLFLSVIKGAVNKVLLINSMYLVLGVSLSVSGLLSPSAYPYFVVLTAMSGVSGAIYNSCFNTVLQETINPSMLGRVFSMYFSVALLPSLIGLVGIGFFADTVGLARTFVLLGAVIFVLGVISFTIPSLTDLGKKGTAQKTEATLS